MTVDIRILVPDPAEPLFGASWHVQGDLLEAPLRAAGAAVSFSPWTASDDLSRADLVLPLLAWGYHALPDRWAQRLASIEGTGARLFNRAETLRWNTDKRYLARLAERGLPVVPTLYAEAFAPADLECAEAAFGTPRLVVKPPVSAGASSTFLLDAREAPSANGADWHAALGQPMLLQPMMPAIAAEGEFSLFYFNGSYSHAVLKTVASGDFRVQAQHGGSAYPATPPAAAMAAAETVLAAIGEPLLYARVDLIADGAGGYLLMELELIEPQLFLEHAPDQGRAFATAVIAAAR